MTSPLQQKIKVKGPVVVTANRLSDGAVVYRTAEGSWSRALQDAAVVTTSEAATRLLAEAAADDVSVVGAYVAPVELAGSDVRPGNLRERIRLGGLTFAMPAASGM
jgi:hypothetical protein